MGGSPNFAFFFSAAIRPDCIVQQGPIQAHMADLAPSDAAMEVWILCKWNMAFSRSLVGSTGVTALGRSWRRQRAGIGMPTRSLPPSGPLAGDRGDLRAPSGADGDRPGLRRPQDMSCVHSVVCILYVR